MLSLQKGQGTQADTQDGGRTPACLVSVLLCVPAALLAELLLALPQCRLYLECK